MEPDWTYFLLLTGILTIVLSLLAILKREKKTT
jgi:hypothetical protein